MRSNDIKKCLTVKYHANTFKTHEPTVRLNNEIFHTAYDIWLYFKEYGTLTKYLTSGLTDGALRLQASDKSTIIKLRNINHLSQMLADQGAKSCIELYASLRIPRVNAGRIFCLTESSYINIYVGELSYLNRFRNWIRIMAGALSIMHLCICGMSTGRNPCYQIENMQ